MASLSAGRRVFKLISEFFFRCLYISLRSNQSRVNDIFVMNISVDSKISMSRMLREKLTETFWPDREIGVSSFLQPGRMISFPQSCSSLPSMQSSIPSQRCSIGMQKASSQAKWSGSHACSVKLVVYVVFPLFEHVNESLWTTHRCEPRRREFSGALDVAKKSTFLACLIFHVLSCLSYLHSENMGVTNIQFCARLQL